MFEVGEEVQVDAAPDAHDSGGELDEGCSNEGESGLGLGLNEHFQHVISIYNEGCGRSFVEHMQVAFFPSVHGSALVAFVEVGQDHLLGVPPDDLLRCAALDLVG